MLTAVTGNVRILSQLVYARNTLNGINSFRLFANDVTISPGNSVTDFIEPTWTGYTRINTQGKFGAPLKVVDGWYQLVSDAFVITPSQNSAELVYGWTITNGGEFWYAARFPTPLPVVNGVPFSIIVTLLEQSNQF